ncbi:MAG: PadR family transcriptional regulator [Thermoleophilia bacterium]
MSSSSQRDTCHSPASGEHGCGCHSGSGSGRARCRCAAAPGEWDVHARVERFSEPALLLLLRQQPRHGYELLERLPSLIGDDAQADIGNVYRLLRRLEHEGVLSSEWRSDLPGPAKRTYTLTESGKSLLDSWAQALGGAHARITAFLSAYQQGR